MEPTSVSSNTDLQDTLHTLNGEQNVSVVDIVREVCSWLHTHLETPFLVDDTLHDITIFIISRLKSLELEEQKQYLDLIWSHCAETEQRHVLIRASRPREDKKARPKVWSFWHLLFAVTVAENPQLCNGEVRSKWFIPSTIFLDHLQWYQAECKPKWLEPFTYLQSPLSVYFVAWAAIARHLHDRHLEFTTLYALYSLGFTCSEGQRLTAVASAHMGIRAGLRVWNLHDRTLRALQIEEGKQGRQFSRESDFSSHMSQFSGHSKWEQRLESCAGLKARALRAPQGSLWQCLRTSDPSTFFFYYLARTLLVTEGE